MKYVIKDKSSIDSEYIKKLNMHSRDGYEVSDKLFSQEVSWGRYVNCPACNTSNIVILKGDGFQINGLDFIGIICNECRKVYYFYDVRFRN